MTNHARIERMYRLSQRLNQIVEDMKIRQVQMDNAANKKAA